MFNNNDWIINGDTCNHFAIIGKMLTNVRSLKTTNIDSHFVTVLNQMKWKRQKIRKKNFVFHLFFIKKNKTITIFIAIHVTELAK